MCARFLVLLLFIGITQQGFADLVTSGNKSGNLREQKTDIFDVAVETFVDAYPGLRFVTGLLRGAAYCRAVFAEVVSQFGSHLEALHGFKVDADAAYKQYQKCNEVPEANAAMVCKEVVKFEYYDSVRTRFRRLKETFLGMLSNAAKLPLCYFVRE